MAKVGERKHIFRCYKGSHINDGRGDTRSQVKLFKASREGSEWWKIRLDKKYISSISDDIKVQYQ